ARRAAGPQRAGAAVLAGDAQGRGREPSAGGAARVRAGSSGHGAAAAAGERDVGVSAQRLLDLLLDLVVVALAGMAKHDAALAVDQIHRGPILVAPDRPGAKAVVLRHRPGHAEPANGRLQV